MISEFVNDIEYEGSSGVTIIMRVLEVLLMVAVAVVAGCGEF